MRIEKQANQAVVGAAVLAVLAWGGCGSSNEQGEITEAHEVHAEASQHEGGECEHEEGEECEHEGAEHERGEHERGEHEGAEHEGAEHERGEHEHGEHEGAEHGHAAGPVSDFHALIGPFWHADRGAARTDGTCGAIADFRTKAAAIETGAVPEAARANEAGYRQAATSLKAAVEALATACGQANRPTFEARFQAVHEAFHQVSQTASGQGH